MRALRLVLWPLGAAVGIAAESRLYGWSDVRHWLPDLVAGWTLLACGLVAWTRRPQSRSGPLLAATGLAWFMGNFSAAALYLHRGPLAHAVLTYPDGRTRGRLERGAVVAGYAVALSARLSASETAAVVVASVLGGV